MQIKFTTEQQEFIIEFDEKEIENVKRQIRQCLDGSYYYTEIEDLSGVNHYIPLTLIKNSYITISAILQEENI